MPSSADELKKVVATFKRRTKVTPLVMSGVSGLNVRSTMGKLLDMVRQARKSARAEADGETAWRP